MNVYKVFEIYGIQSIEHQLNAYTNEGFILWELKIIPPDTTFQATRFLAIMWKPPIPQPDPHAQ